MIEGTYEVSASRLTLEIPGTKGKLALKYSRDENKKGKTGGFVLGLAENYGSALIGSEWRDVVAFLLLVLILLFRPTGLLGESLGRSRA